MWEYYLQLLNVNKRQTASSLSLDNQAGEQIRDRRATERAKVLRAERALGKRPPPSFPSARLLAPVSSSLISCFARAPETDWKGTASSPYKSVKVLHEVREGGVTRSCRCTIPFTESQDWKESEWRLTNTRFLSFHGWRFNRNVTREKKKNKASCDRFMPTNRSRKYPVPRCH